MARSIPTIEPVQARAGDTWQWTKQLSDYPASTWTLSYTFYNASGVFSITASADGDKHSVAVAPITTGTYTAGRYDWHSSVTDGTDVHQIGSGVIDVLPDLSTATSYDARSHARKMLDLINAALEGRATDEQLATVRADLNARSVQYDIPGLILVRKQYAAAVRAEDDAIKIARGESPGRIIGVRFVG